MMVMLALTTSAMVTSSPYKQPALTPTTLATPQTFATTLLVAILPLVVLRPQESALTPLISAKLPYVMTLQDVSSFLKFALLMIPIATKEFAIQL